MKFNKAAFFAMLLISLSGFVWVSWADELDEDQTGVKSTDFIKSRTYIGIVGISQVIDSNGDFNGLNTMEFGPVTFQTTPVTLTTLPEYDLIPEINRNFGFGILAGHREGPWAVEVSFWRSDCTATYSGGGPVTFTYPASFQSINVDFKRYIFTQLPTQPFVSLGVCFPWVWVSQGSEIINGSIVTQNDETISGIGFELGAGLEIYLDKNFSLVGGGFQRWTGFNQVNGAEKLGEDGMYFDGNPSNVGAIEGDGLNFYVGTTVGFQ
jgi:hypothetical protein